MKICNYSNKYFKCDRSVWKENDDKCILHSSLIDKKRKQFEVEWKKIFKELTNISKKSFGIEGIIFPNDLSFEDFTILLDFGIYNCEVYGNLIFNRTKFNGRCNLVRNKIYGNVEFNDCTFHDNFRDSGNYVKNQYKFLSNTCESGVCFIKTNINDNFVFSLTSVLGQFEIIECNVKKNWFFYGIDFSSMSRARFREVKLSNASFYDSKIIDIDFIAVDWGKINGRYILYDEKLLFDSFLKNNEKTKDDMDFVNKIKDDKNKFSIINSIYLQLCANYDRRRMFDYAGKFYISSMEIKRKSKSWIKGNIFSWEALYQHISNYGQSSNKPLFWIIIVYLIYNLISTIFINTLSRIQSDKNIFYEYLDALKLNFLYLVNISSWKVGASFGLLDILFGLERIIIIILVALFVLSLKRRFRRN